MKIVRGFSCDLILRYFTRPGKHTKKAIENGPVEIVDLPIKNGDFPSFFVCLLEGTCGLRGCTKDRIGPIFFDVSRTFVKKHGVAHGGFVRVPHSYDYNLTGAKRREWMGCWGLLRLLPVVPHKAVAEVSE